MPSLLDRTAPPHRLLDHIMKQHKFKTDRELGRLLELGASSISKIRHGKVPVLPATILKIHEATEMSIKEIRALLD
jgi:transcriptional regulator with XRE-family HTH domain